MSDDISADEARRLREAATPGPWEWSHHRIWSGVNEVLSGDTFDGGSGRMNISQGDADLIAAAPDLAATVERLTAQRDEAVRLLREAHPMHPQPDICPACAFLPTSKEQQP